MTETTGEDGHTHVWADAGYCVRCGQQLDVDEIHDACGEEEGDGDE